MRILVRSSFAAVVALVALSTLPETALAQGFDVQQFNPAPARSSAYFGLLGARVLDHAEWEMTALLDYADDPLVLYDADGDRAQSIVSRQLTVNVLGAVGIADRLQLGIDVPIVVLQEGDDIAVIDAGSASDPGGGIGDLRFVPTVLLFGPSEPGVGGPSMTLSVDTYLPTGDDEHFQGEGFRIAPRLGIDYTVPSDARVGVELGYTVRPESAVANLEVDDTFTWGVGAEVPVGASRNLRLAAELAGEVAILATSGIQTEESPIEALLGAKWRHESGFGLEGAFGTGLVTGFGTPDWRALFGVAFAPPSDPDRDDDGFLNDEDGCPDEAEDVDGFADDDGCYDADNDADGFPDVSDECPDTPEDVDEYEDDDGCPEPDNDFDTVRDTDDACLFDPEDIDGFEDDDGCPDPDNDADAILDIDDACPNEAEDFDGFDDADGCPDPDNDLDGYADEDDGCPTEPEDFDGFADEDGCPDEGEGLVELTCAGIEIRESVHFRTDSDQIRSRSHELLDQVASVLRNASAVRRVRIEGHTDSRGSDEHNLDLSERRAAAVREYLIGEGGIAPERLESQGFGETVPIADNDDSDGRAVNRRVEFVIVDQERCRE